MWYMWYTYQAIATSLSYPEGPLYITHKTDSFIFSFSTLLSPCLNRPKQVMWRVAICVGWLITDSLWIFDWPLFGTQMLCELPQCEISWNTGKWESFRGPMSPYLNLDPYPGWMLSEQKYGPVKSSTPVLPQWHWVSADVVSHQETS